MHGQVGQLGRRLFVSFQCFQVQAVGRAGEEEEGRGSRVKRSPYFYFVTNCENALFGIVVKSEVEWSSRVYYNYINHVTDHE